MPKTNLSRASQRKAAPLGPGAATGVAGPTPSVRSCSRLSKEPLQATACWIEFHQCCQRDRPKKKTSQCRFRARPPQPTTSWHIWTIPYSCTRCLSRWKGLGQYPQRGQRADQEYQRQAPSDRTVRLKILHYRRRDRVCPAPLSPAPPVASARAFCSNLSQIGGFWE